MEGGLGLVRDDGGLQALLGWSGTRSRTMGFDSLPPKHQTELLCMGLSGPSMKKIDASYIFSMPCLVLTMY